MIVKLRDIMMRDRQSLVDHSVNVGFLCGARRGRVEGIDKITLVAVMRIEG